MSLTRKTDGTFLLKSSVADVGPGSATIMAQIAADTLDVEIEKIKFKWGNSLYPEAPGQFGSHTTTSVGSAVHDVCIAFKERLAELNREQTDAQDNPAELTVTRESGGGSEREKFSGKSFCANFVEVQVNAYTGEVKVTRVVSAVDAGTIINHKTATSQVIGSVVWGTGMALMEEGIIDHRYGRYVNNDLANYHLPVNADIPEVEVILIDKRDPVIDPMGAKGIGEIPLVGFTAAVANAVYHATGKRIRELPITPDKLV